MGADFSTLELNATLLAPLTAQNIVVPTEVQREAIPVVLSGRDAIVVAQTGSGKTLAYLLPALTQLAASPATRALILTPSRETAEQAHRVLAPLAAELKISAALAMTGPPMHQQAKDLNKNPRIIVATPGRMTDHLKNNKLLLKGLSLLIVDEADRMLELGFEEQLKFVQTTLRGERQTLMFAASFGPRAEPVAQLFLKPDAVHVRASAAGAPVETLSQRVCFMQPSQKQNRLRDELKRVRGGVLIFAESQESCVAIGRFLEHHAFSSEFIHGNMNPGHRNRVLREFREEKMQILVTTDMLARGLDVPTVRHVISYDLPYRGEEFLHRIGRTARAGREGEAITFVTPTDGRTFRRLKPYLEGAKEEMLATEFAFINDEQR